MEKIDRKLLDPNSGLVSNNVWCTLLRNVPGCPGGITLDYVLDAVAEILERLLEEEYDRIDEKLTRVYGELQNTAYLKNYYRRSREEEKASAIACIEKLKAEIDDLTKQLIGAKVADSIKQNSYYKEQYNQERIAHNCLKVKHDALEEKSRKSIISNHRILQHHKRESKALRAKCRRYKKTIKDMAVGIEKLKEANKSFQQPGYYLNTYGANKLSVRTDLENIPAGTDVLLFHKSSPDQTYLIIPYVGRKGAGGQYLRKHPEFPQGVPFQAGDTGFGIIGWCPLPNYTINWSTGKHPRTKTGRRSGRWSYDPKIETELDFAKLESMLKYFYKNTGVPLYTYGVDFGPADSYTSVYVKVTRPELIDYEQWNSFMAVCK